MVEVRGEYIGTGGCESKSVALRYTVKQSCEEGAVLYTTKENLSQHADGHLTRLRAVTYPVRGHATQG